MGLTIAVSQIYMNSNFLALSTHLKGGKAINCTDYNASRNKEKPIR